MPIGYHGTIYFAIIYDAAYRYEILRRQKAANDLFWRPYDAELQQAFNDQSLSEVKKYDFLFSYFVLGFLHYRTPNCGIADYPGASSRNGKRADEVEGFTRICPLISSWIASGRDRNIQLPDGRRVDLLDIVRTGLLSGTNPKSPDYWGRIRDYDQRICEASDVALSVWLLRKSLWASLDDSQKKQVITWLMQIKDKQIPDNNWHLFPVMIYEVISKLGYPIDDVAVRQNYNRFKSFYRGDGWFSDGPGEAYDYYNAWAMHYSLFWLDLINSQFDHVFINQCLGTFLENYKYFFSPKGFPIEGRSICYRMASTAPLVAGVIKGNAHINPGMAWRAFNCIWTFFIRRGAVARGCVTQGYCKRDLRFLDTYSGPASCLWSLRSLVLAFYASKDSPFWHSPPEKLPVELGSYDIRIPAIGWRIKGNRTTEDVTIVDTRIKGTVAPCVESYNIFHRVVGSLLNSPWRPHNTEAKYDHREYDTIRPFCGCSN